jgi:hypothetical protein
LLVSETENNEANVDATLEDDHLNDSSVIEEIPQWMHWSMTSLLITLPSGEQQQFCPRCTIQCVSIS